MIYWASDYTYIWPDVEARELEEFRKGNLMIEEVNDETASAAAAADSEQQVNHNFFILHETWHRIGHETKFIGLCQ